MPTCRRWDDDCDARFDGSVSPAATATRTASPTGRSSPGPSPHHPNYSGPHPAKLDAIAFREGISSEHAVARVRSGEWDGAILFDDLLAPGGVVAREARASGGRYRTEELPVRGAAYPGEKGSIHGLFSSRLGCDTIDGVFDLITLCVHET
jgi:hypothetical protein